MAVATELAINGGPRVRTEGFPGRGHFGIEEKRAVDALFDAAIQTGNAIGYGGEQEDAYCREFADMLGGGFADGVSSGTASVYVALRSLDLEPFTEVVVSPITDPGGMMPITMLNCIPVPADCAPGSFNIGPEQVEAAITPYTSAILVAHIGGVAADIEGIMAVAKKHGLPVVEDCSQAHYAKINGRLVGTFGDVAAFSTMFGKHHCTGGQGGIVFTKNEKIYQKIRWASDRGKPFGLPTGSTNCLATLNYNMDEIAAAIGRVQLSKLPQIVARRREIVSKLNQSFGRMKSVIIPEELPGAESSYWWQRLGLDTSKLLCSTDEFCRALAAEGIPADFYAALPHTYDWFKNRRVFGSSGYPWSSPDYKGDAKKEFPCPNAHAALEDYFLLSINEGWGEKEIADTVEAFMKVESAYLK